MAFNPDAYLAESEQFDPDAYLSETDAIDQEVDPQAQLDAMNDAQSGSAETASTGIGVADAGLEFAAAFNRGATKLADFLTTDQINAVSQVLGSEFRVPSITDTLSAGTSGGFMPEGMARDVVRSAGEVVPSAVATGGVLRSMASKLPAFTSASEGIAAGAIRQMGQTGAASDVVYGAASGAGGEYGRQEGGTAGQLAGAVIAPLSIAAGQASIKGLISAGKQGLTAFNRTVEGMSDDGASTLLSEMMIREGLSPEDVAKEVSRLGDDATLADAGNNFARLLRLAANKVPRIEGRVGSELGARQSGQGQRILSAFDDSAGIPKLSMDDEIIRLQQVEGPKIKGLYDKAREGTVSISQKLNNMLENSPSMQAAAKEADNALGDISSMGQKVSNLDRLDAIKKSLDDMIGVALRQGENSKVARLSELKNTMVAEVDLAIPAYKEARNAFAGKAQLENAAEFGTNYFKLKPTEVARLTQSMGESEKRFFRLGAKQAIIDKLDSMQLNRDAIKAMFGRGGDASKLRSLFATEKQFNTFSDAMEREAQFVMTRRAAQENSTTAKQLFDDKSMTQALNDARRVATDPLEAAAFLGSLTGKLSAKKGSEANIKALEKVGDILLERGMPAERIESLLRKGSEKQIESALRGALSKSGSSKTIAPMIGSAIAPDQRQSQQ